MSYGIAREVATSATPAHVLDVLADLSRKPEWDSLCVEACKEFGDGGAGSVYRLRFKVLTQECRVEVTLAQAQLPWIRIGGNGHSLDVSETYTVRDSPAGRIVSISAVYTFHGWLGRVGRLAEPLIERRWDESCTRLAALLDSYGVEPHPAPRA